jgi:glycosyltransferase involved in cell wall biosynthesis
MITKNEERNIAAALESVKGFADEIILVDGYSTDKTVETARSYGAKITQKTFISFKEQKGAALAAATKEWVLNLDADETLGAELKAEILQTIKDTPYNGFYLPSSNIFLGRRMKWGSLRKDYKLRLARRAAASYEGGKVHEVLSVQGVTPKLKNALNHTPYRDIRHYFEKFNNYTSLGAESMHEKGKKFNPLQMLRPFWEFPRIYIIRLGFLDGYQGFLWAAFSSFYPFVKYAKLWELNKKSIEKKSF